jgi:hypothetical protein
VRADDWPEDDEEEVDADAALVAADSALRSALPSTEADNSSEVLLSYALTCHVRFMRCSSACCRVCAAAAAVEDLDSDEEADLASADDDDEDEEEEDDAVRGVEGGSSTSTVMM